MTGNAASELPILHRVLPWVGVEEIAFVTRQDGLEQGVLELSFGGDRVEGLEEPGDDAVLVQHALAELVADHH